MVSARRGVTMRAWLCAQLYAAIDQELNDYPEWRYQTKRAEGKEPLRNSRRSSERLRNQTAARKQAETFEPEVVL